ncbi:transglycosylase SLT domain-containing protein [Streptomyces sp. NBC_01190]|uniref:transglycosylase SLT domain-containing protein n=1 Tax=Streptomyces sp. NBC_01190 TaxID=2903767 RepID=UPI00386C71EB|nr:transglycosylase SLT domain-containing protein [Streptomyces sp. NBC_01190]
MQLPTIPNKLPTFSKFNRLSKKRKIAAGALAASALVLTVTGLEATAGAGSATAAGAKTGFSVSTGQHVKPLGAQSGMASQSAIHSATTKKQAPAAPAAAAKKQAPAAAKSVTEAKKPAAPAVPKAKPAPRHQAVKVAVSAPRPAHVAAPRPAVKTYPNNLDGWIRQSLDIMHAKGIPGSYSGIHRNIIRESSGNPNAINLWDINAKNGIPSKGLLQVINPTFSRYHVPGTSWNIYNPVSNITAACNYAADRYGSMDNVNSAY